MTDRRKNNKNNKNNRSPRPIWQWYLIGAAIILAIQMFVLPTVKNSSIKEVSYSEFVQKLSSGEIKELKEESYQYLFKTGDKENEQVYRVGKWRDPDITSRLLDAQTKFGTEIVEPTNPIILFLVQLVVPLAIMFLGIRFITKNMMGGSNAMSFGKSNAKIYIQPTNAAKFKDVAGQDEAKESLEEIVDFLHNPKKYAKIGAVTPKGVLLVGPPGTGKTLLAKAVAGEANVPFFSLSGSEFVEMFVGLGASKVRDLFKQANEKAPCIVFIDEIDAIGKRRDTSGYSGNDEREQTLNQLLNEMDGFDATSGVIILAATNRPEILDPALTRPGRFDRQVRVELPDIKGREEILEVHAKKVKMDKDVNLKNIARMTAGASGADLANIINEGALKAVREGRNSVTEEDLSESVEVVIAGQKKKNAVITQKEKEIIAYHEVGHAIAAVAQEDTAPVTKITIIPRTSGALGYTMQVEEEEKFLMSKDDLFREMVTLAGGRSAEEIIFNIKTTGASNDIERTTNIARAMVATYGMDEDFNFVLLEKPSSQYLKGSGTNSYAATETENMVDKKIMEIINQSHAKAHELLNANIDKLHEISKYLLEQETITGEQFMDIFHNEYVLTEKPDYIKNLEEKIKDQDVNQDSEETIDELEDSDKKED
ncbi:ATP-dependent zinc metalloprotease FtsH [uncultured Helcococcus sp.]|uniref:ATP-dependent zinc metalloprotease FtsH n=1 Tax=uncultured Helcococcus sp. TaxID=1072508 RepID=UPI00288BA8E2|nr:ATP-dependent zinc metalloprotease FtsH [uncultured Helcococcus sp.]